MALTEEAMKRRRIGASDAAACMGESPFEDPVELVLRLQGKMPPKEETQPMEFGTFNEPLVGRLFARDTGLKIIRPIWPWSDREYERWVCYSSGAEPMDVDESFGAGPADYMTSTPDFLVWLDDELCFAPVECKAVNGYVADKWEDEVPQHYYWQNVHQCCGLDSPVGFVAAMVGNANRFVHKTTPTDDERKRLIEREGAIWRHVEAGTLPDPNSMQGVKAKWPTHEEMKVAPATDDVIEALNDLLQFSASEKESKAKREAALLVIAKHMGDAEMLVDGQEILATYRADKRGRRTFRPKV